MFLLEIVLNRSELFRAISKNSLGTALNRSEPFLSMLYAWPKIHTFYVIQLPLWISYMLTTKQVRAAGFKCIFVCQILVPLYVGIYDEIKGTHDIKDQCHLLYRCEQRIAVAGQLVAARSELQQHGSVNLELFSKAFGSRS